MLSLTRLLMMYAGWIIGDFILNKPVDNETFAFVAIVFMWATIFPERNE